MKTGGNPYGTHRVISPKGVLPQPADVIDNDMEIYNNELKINVQTLNIDSASFTSVVDHACGKKPTDDLSAEDIKAIKNSIATCWWSKGALRQRCSSDLSSAGTGMGGDPVQGT